MIYEDYVLVRKSFALNIGALEKPLKMSVGDVLVLVTSTGDTARMEFLGLYIKSDAKKFHWNKTAFCFRSMKTNETIWVNYRQLVHDRFLANLAFESYAVEKRGLYYATQYNQNPKKRNMQDEVADMVQTMNLLVRDQFTKFINFYAPTNEELSFFSKRRFGDYDWLFIWFYDIGSSIRPSMKFHRVLCTVNNFFNEKMFLQMVTAPLAGLNDPTIASHLNYNEKYVQKYIPLQSSYYYVSYGYDITPSEFLAEFVSVLDNPQAWGYNAKDGLIRQRRESKRIKEMLKQRKKEKNNDDC